MIQEAKENKKDLVFTYVKGLGNVGKIIFGELIFLYLFVIWLRHMDNEILQFGNLYLVLDHAIVTKIAFVYAENIMFGLTTNTELAARFEG